MIRLFIENKEVEIDESVQVAITKQFEDLSNPTVIINDWSKTVSIPFTVNNNKIFGHIYNPDKAVVDGGSIGVYFDPLKKLSFRIEWDNAILMTGYAKLNEVKQINGKGTYDITLFGELGKVFQEMKKITFDTTTEDTDYLIHGEDYVEEYINKDLVYASWTSTGQTHSNLEEKWIRRLNPETMEVIVTPNLDYSVTDIIGFAPNNAFSEGFDYKTFEIRDYETDTDTSVTFINVLEKGFEGFPTFAEITGIQPDTVIPNGMSPRGIGEYRSYLQLPFIYWNKLFQLFQKKVESLTGYKFILDNDWFNISNPYWYNTVYMLKQFNPKSGDTKINTYTADSSHGSHAYADIIPPNTEQTAYDPRYFENGAFFANYSGNSPVDTNWREARNISLSLTRFNINEQIPITTNNQMRLKLSPNERVVTQRMHIYGETELYYGEAIQGLAYTTNIWQCYDFSSDAAMCVNLVFTGENGIVKKQIGVIANENPSQAIQNLIATNATSVYYLKEEDRHPNKVVGPNGDIIRYTGAVWDYSLEFPEETLLYSEFGNYVTISIETFYRFGTSATIPFEKHTFTPSGEYPITPPEWSDKYKFGIVTNIDSELRVMIDIFRSGSKFILNDLWNNDYNIFNEILRYCKMFRLNIEVDDINKKIKFIPFTKYFENYTVKDWTNKVDKSKDFNIKPITFENKYVLFNYNEGDTKIKEDYNKKFGFQYGEYRVVTNYNFNNDTIELFEGQNPSNIISPLVLTWDTLFRNNEIIYRVPNESYIDVSDKDNKTKDTFGQFYFLNGLQTFTTENMPIVVLTDDSYLMKWNQTYFYLGGYSLETDIYINVLTFPKLSLVYNNNMITFGIPKENYDVTTTYDNKKGIYSNFWEKYLDERYNVQNKVITCYVDLKPHEYNQFAFNQLVKIGNQLCMVNKIYDYDITTNHTTKVDLITIQDIEGYTTDNY